MDAIQSTVAAPGDTAERESLLGGDGGAVKERGASDQEEESDTLLTSEKTGKDQTNAGNWLERIKRWWGKG